MKDFLKAAGYGKDQLYMLGDYRDAITADLVPAMGQEETMRAAFQEYGRNARYPHTGGMVEDPDGQLVMIYDEDATTIHAAAACPRAARARLILARMAAPSARHTYGFGSVLRSAR
jgi:hypothetical protein